MKFGKLLDRARVLGCDCIVTGHYARIEETDNGFVLKKALDETKDQSYVLYSMTQEQLSHTVFPLGGMRKSEVRDIAGSSGFVNANKPDSQDICFVPDGDYARVVEMHAGRSFAEGNFVDREGNILGRHKGIIRYTVGQRRGLGISAAEPLYVCEIRPESAEVVLGVSRELLCSTVRAADFNWISGEAPKNEFRCRAKLRYRQPEQWVTVTPVGTDEVTLRFDDPQKAPAPGQAAVLYDGDTVIGGGTIKK